MSAKAAEKHLNTDLLTDADLERARQMWSA